MPTLGSYALHAIDTGTFRLDGGSMFGIVPKPLWEQRIPADERNRITLSMRCLLLQSDDHVALIDCGIGEAFSPKFKEIYAVDHAEADLRSSLAAVGVRPPDVTDVILTHLHFDHCGGITCRADDGERVLTFPEARHHVQKAHWEWAQSPNPKEANSFREEHLRPLADSEHLCLADGGGELLPDVWAMLAHGHTRAQQVIRISGREGTLVFAADLLPTTAHLAPAWTMAYDVEPLTTIREKQDFLEQATEEEWILFFEHDAAVEVSDLRRTSRGIEVSNPRSLAALWSR